MLQFQRNAGNRATGQVVAAVQRQMKFEIQTPNTIVRNDGDAVVPLDRKYGPEDFLVTGSSGVRLESETRGVLEFETGWSKKWSQLREQVAEAVEMTKKMNAAKDVGSGRKEFPFDVANLRTGTRKELKRGVWKRRKGMEGGAEKILRDEETLEVAISDPDWNSGIQSSEGLLLVQYESFLKQHEWPDYREPVIASADDILDSVRPKGKSAPKLDNLRSFLQMIVNYIKRGQGGEASDRAGAFADVKGMPAKQAFTLMSRTDFSSIYSTLLSKAEQRLYRKIVRSGVILTEMGFTKKHPFFIEGFGTHGHHKGPTIQEWLVGIHQGKDALSVQTDSSLSAAMGKYDVESKPGKKDSQLVKFETRNTVLGAFKTAKDWEEYAHDLFTLAATQRKRKTGKGETGLEP